MTFRVARKIIIIKYYFLKGNGEVEFNEFAIWMSIKQSDKNQISMDLENTFKIFDENGDHFIVRTHFYLIEIRILSKYLNFL